MDNKKLDRIFAESECVSNQLMQNYLDGKLSSREKNIVEVHIESCELCKDEFEGLRSMNDRNKLSDIVSDLNRKISMRTHKHKRHVLFPQVSAMAAIILLLIGFVWFFFYIIHLSPESLMKKEMAQSLEEKKEKEEIQKIIAENKINPNVKIDIPVGKAETKETVPSVIREENNLKSEDIQFNLDDEKVADADLSQDKIIILEKKLRKNDIITKDTNNLAEDNTINSGSAVNSDYANVSSESEKDINRAKSKKEENNKGLMPSVSYPSIESAMDQYNNKNYQKAINLFLNIENKSTNKDELYYYLAKSYEATNKVNKAIIYYDKVIAISSSKFYENALWNKTQLLIKSGNKSKAIQNLNLIIGNKGPNSNKALQQLDSLNNK
jgi:tetratricopeptide (TPR) repeat protein